MGFHWNDDNEDFSVHAGCEIWGRDDDGNAADEADLFLHGSKLDRNFIWMCGLLIALSHHSGE